MEKIYVKELVTFLNSSVSPAAAGTSDLQQNEIRETEKSN